MGCAMAVLWTLNKHPVYVLVGLVFVMLTFCELAELLVT